MPNKTIGIDARFYGPLGKGLGRYTQEIVDQIIRINDDRHYAVFLCKENYDDFQIPEAVSNRVRKVLADVRWYSLAEQWKLPYLIWKEKITLMHFPHFNVPIITPCRFIVTVHDLILTKFPTVRATTLPPLMYKLKNLAYRLVIWHALRFSRCILTVSEFTKNDIVLQFKADPKKIIVTYEGVANLAKGRDSLFSKNFQADEVLKGYGLQPGYWLYVGNAYPHKNLEGLLRMFSSFKKNHSEARLVLVGKEDFFYLRVKQLAKNLGLYSGHKESDPVVFSGYVPDAELEIFFQQAIGYIFPSFYEGFGLPPLEAMAKGCPVLSSKESSMPEILGDAAAYFDPHSESELTSLMERLVVDNAWREDMIRRGKEHIKRFSWWECAQQTWKAYKKYGD
jgi:glycosyltransferase involved in cell wall biosynthesis